VAPDLRETIWHKPLSRWEGQKLIDNDVDLRLGGLPDLIDGSVTLAAFVAELRGAASYYEALGLNYQGSLFSPEEPLYSLRFKLSYAVSIDATDGPLAGSIGTGGGVDLGYGLPYTGNGFTSLDFA